jgi:hypothetical protein
VTVAPKATAGERLSHWVGRPGFWWLTMALLGGVPLLSGVLRLPPQALPVLGTVPATGTGRLVVLADPACPRCCLTAAERLRGLSRHLRGVRTAFELVWVPLGEGGAVPPGVRVLAGPEARPYLNFAEGRPERSQLWQSRVGLLVDGRGRVRAFPRLDGAAQDPELLPAVTQLINGR